MCENWISLLVLTLWCVPNVELKNRLFYGVQNCWNVSLKSVPLSVWEECAEGQNVLHCLPDNNDILGLVCYPIQWIVKGFCPYYNTYLGNMDQKRCDGTDCPDKDFKSPNSLKFSGCYPKEQQTTASTTTLPRATSTSPSKPTDMMDSTLSTNNSSVCQNRSNSEDNGDCDVVTAMFCIIVICIITALISVIVKAYLLKTSDPSFRNTPMRKMVLPRTCFTVDDRESSANNSSMPNQLPAMDNGENCEYTSMTSIPLAAVHDGESGANDSLIPNNLPRAMVDGGTGANNSSISNQLPGND